MLFLVSGSLSFALFLEALLFMFSSFSPLVLKAGFSFCHRPPGLLVASVGVFLLSPVVLWVLLGLRILPCPCVRGFSYQGVLVLCLRFVSIRPPSFPAPQVSYGLVVVSPGWSPPLWLYSFTRPTFVHCGLVLCCLSPVGLPHLGRGYVVSSVFVSYAVCLCRLCSWCLRDGVTLAWVECRCCFLHSIGTKATFLSVLSIPSGWGHPLGQVYFLFPLISIEGLL